MSKAAKKIPAGSPEERILAVATELFYTQGYRATGINEVIARSGVAKATFYNHFPSKEALCLAYLENAVGAEMVHLRAVVAGAGTDPRARFLAVMRWLEEWLDNTGRRGCPALHIVAEVPDPNSPLRQPGKKLYSAIRAVVEPLAAELIAAEPERYGHLDAGELSNEYMLAVGGSIALAEVYNADWPMGQAVAMLRRRIGE